MGKHRTRHIIGPMSTEDRRALYTPSWVIELGNCLYVADKGEEPVSRDQALRSVDGYKGYRAGFRQPSPERVYLEKLLHIAVSVAHGKRRRKEEYNDELDRLKQGHDLSVQQLLERDKRYGEWLDAWLPKMLSFGGGFCITQAVYDVTVKSFGIDGPSVDGIGFWLSGGVATGFPSVLKGAHKWKFYRDLKGMENEYAKGRGKLREALKLSVREEYRMAIRRAQDAWRESFGALPEGEKTPEEYVNMI